MSPVLTAAPGWETAGHRSAVSFLARSNRGKSRVPNPTVAPLEALSAFHVSIDPNAGVGDGLGSSGAGTKEEMARLEGETSNALFETLEDWESQLKQADQELRTLKRDPRGPSL